MASISNLDIKGIIVKVVPDLNLEKIEDDTLLREYNIDSIDFFSIILEVQDACGIEIPDEDLDQCRTVNSIQRYCAQR